jgi:hypothetical protein
MRVPKQQRDVAHLEPRGRQRGEQGRLVCEADVDAPLAEYLVERPVEVDEAARLRMAVLLAQGVDAYVRLERRRPTQHRDDVDVGCSPGECIRPRRHVTERGVPLVHRQIQDQEVEGRRLGHRDQPTRRPAGPFRVEQTSSPAAAAV